MEHPLEVHLDGTVDHLRVVEGQAVAQGEELLRVTAPPSPRLPPRRLRRQRTEAAPEPGARADLAALHRRRELLTDAARPEAVAKRHGLGLRTARENVEDLCDPGTFAEYGGFAFAAQEARRARGGPPGEHAGRRADHRDRAGQRRAGARGPGPVRGGGLRLHGARRHPGPAQPRQEGPHLRAGRAAAAAGGALRRGRRRPARRHGRAGDRRARHPSLRALRPALGPRAHGRDRRRAVLRRQRRAARLLRHGDRHRGQQHRDGRPGDDRGRRARHVTAPRTSARSTSRWPTAWSTSPVADEAEAVAVAKQYLSYFQGPVAPGAEPDQTAAADGHPGEPQAHLRRAPGDRRPRRRGLGAGAAPGVRHRDHHRAGAPRGRAGRDHRQRPGRRWAARSTRPPRTRPPGSSSCATATTSPCSRCATRRASWSAPRPRRRRRCAASPGCSSRPPR